MVALGVVGVPADQGRDHWPGKHLSLDFSLALAALLSRADPRYIGFKLAK